MKWIVAHIDAVDQHRAARNVVKTRNQVDQRRFARAGSADDADGLTFFNCKADIAQLLVAVVRIVEADIFEFDLRSAVIFFYRNIIRFFHDARLRLKDLVDALGARASLCHKNHEVGDDDHRQQNLRHVADQRDDIARFHVAEIDVDRAEPDDRDDRDIRHRVGDGAEQRRKPAHADGGARQVLGRGVDAFLFALLFGERADDAVAREVLA